VWRQSSDTRIGDLARHIRAGEAEKALVLVGIVVGISGATSKCGSYQNGLYTATFTLISSFNGLASSAELTDTKYRTGKDTIDEISSVIDQFDKNLIDLDNYLPEFSISLQRKIKSNTNLKNLNKQLDALKNQYDSYLVSLNSSMEFSKINSAVIEANTPAVGLNWSEKSSKTITSLKSYRQKLSKSLPIYKCITASQARDIQSNGKCPKGYTKVSLEKPF
jgi:small-conductance mechanosensitive channel